MKKNRNLRKIALTKSLMLTTLLWFSTAIPISYFEMFKAQRHQLLYASLISLAVLMLSIFPISYIGQLLSHRCKKCKELWCFNYVDDIVLGKANLFSAKKGQILQKVLRQKKCRKCGYTQMAQKTKIVQEIS
jgi:hypothetical protein